MKPFLTLVLTLVFSISASAQTTVTPSARDEIVVTASALPEKVESTPAAVTVVTKEEIETRAARDVADVLREVPGLTLARNGSPGKVTSLFTRGANSTHTLVLWNGIEINNPYFAGYDWGRFSTIGVQQVEIVRGPYSALYGSEAVAGVVNVLTTPSRSEIRALAEAGGHGLHNGQLAASWVDGRHAFSASFERRDDDGFERNDDFSQNSANALWRWTAGNRFTLGLAGRYTSYDLGIPRNLSADGTALVASPNRRQGGNERQIAIPLQQTIGRVSYDLTLAESRRDDDFRDPDDPYGFVSATTKSTTRRARLTTRTAIAAGTLVAGAEYERAEVSDRSNFGPNLAKNRRTEKSLFIEDRYSRAIGAMSRIEMSLGLRRDDYATFGSETSPRLAAAWIGGSNKMRLAYGESFRAPSVGELYFPFSGNRNLEPERSRSVEIGYDRMLVGDGQLSATIFRGRYRDLIVFDNATYAFANVGRAQSRGVELALEGHLTSNLHGAISYTYLDTEQNDSAQPLLRRPRNSGSLSIGYRAGNVDTNIVLLYSGRRDDVLPLFPFSRASNRDYTTVDASLQLHLTRFTPYVKVENLAGERYEEVLGYPSPPRRTIVGIRWKR